MESSVFRSDLFTAHEPNWAGSPMHAVVAMPVTEKLITTAHGVSLAPPRGEG